MFSFSSTLKLICIDQKLADHLYFARSKGPADSFPRQSSDKGKIVMESNEEVSLIDVVVAQPTMADQNELILQLMQHIAEMRVECKGDMICLHQVLPLTLLMGDPFSTFLFQTWIKLKICHLHLPKILLS